MIHGVGVAAVVAALIVGANLATPSARATTMVPLSIADLSTMSELVAVVDVTRAMPARVGRRIMTFYEVTVADVWHGPPSVTSSDMVVAVLGGVVGDIGQHVHGMPRLEVGHRYVLCLGKATGPQGARGVVGLWQGAWQVTPSGLIPFLPEGIPSRDSRAALDVPSVQGAFGRSL